MGRSGEPREGQWGNVQDHKRLEHHTLTQNLKAMGLWVPSLIYPLFPPFLVNVGHNHSHLITQHSIEWILSTIKNNPKFDLETAGRPLHNQNKPLGRE